MPWKLTWKTKASNMSSPRCVVALLLLGRLLWAVGGGKGFVLPHRLLRAGLALGRATNDPTVSAKKSLRRKSFATRSERPRGVCRRLARAGMRLTEANTRVPQGQSGGVPGKGQPGASRMGAVRPGLAGRARGRG